jgi:hypothetical protein
MRLVIVLAAATIWTLGLIWLAFQPKLSEAVWQHVAAFIALDCASIASIYFCYFTAKRRPGYELGLAILAVNFALLSMACTAFVLHIENVWIDRIITSTQVLLPLAGGTLIIQNFRKSKAEKSRRGETGENAE